MTDPYDRPTSDRPVPDEATADRPTADRPMVDRPMADPSMAAPPPRSLEDTPPPKRAAPPPAAAAPPPPLGRDYEAAYPRAYAPPPRPVVAQTLARRDLVRWGPIVAGLFTALTTLILLSLLAVALGITAADTTNAGSATGPNDVLSIGAAVTAAVIGVISFFVGGLVAARTAVVGGRGAGALNGFLVWALGVVLILALAAMGLGAILGAAGNVVGATGVPSVNPPNVSPDQVVDVGRNSALGAFISLAVPAIAAALGGAAGARPDLAYDEDLG